MSDSQSRRPNLLLIGAPRCASTALATALGKHPDIFVCSPKEPHFLAMHGAREDVRGPGAETFSRKRRLDPGRWSELFAGRSERYLVDASVSTMTYPDVSIPNIKLFCAPETKILVMLRDPVERAYSSYMYCAARGWEEGDFEHCLEHEAERIERNWQHLWFMQHLSRYEDRLQPFLDAFPRDNLRTVITEEFASRPDEVMRELYEFLDVPSVQIDATVRLNSGGQPRNAVIRRLSAVVHGHPSLRRTAKLLSTRGFRERLRSSSLEKVEMAGDTRERLELSMAPTKAWVRTTLGRQLTEWK